MRHAAEPARIDTDDLNLDGARTLLWRMLCDSALCACKSDPSEPQEQDAAEALGWCRPVRVGDDEAIRDQVERERTAAAQRLRMEVQRETGQALGINLLVERLDRCSAEWACQCPMRAAWSCPRNRELEAAEERKARAHSAITRGVPPDIAEEAAAGRLPRTEAIRTAYSVLEGRLKWKRLVLFSSDSDGSGVQAAGYLLYRRGGGRYVSATELRFARFDDPIRAEVLRQDVLAVVDVPGPAPAQALSHGAGAALLPPPELPRPLLELLEASIERICRVRGKLVLTTRARSTEFLAQFGARTQELFQRFGLVQPIAPEAK